MTSETLTVRVAPEVAKRLRDLAKATKRSKSFLAAEAIEEYLATQEWQVQAIVEGLEQAERGIGVDFFELKKQWESRDEDPTDPQG